MPPKLNATFAKISCSTVILRAAAWQHSLAMSTEFSLAAALAEDAPAPAPAEPATAPSSDAQPAPPEAPDKAPTKKRRSRWDEPAKDDAAPTAAGEKRKKSRWGDDPVSCLTVGARCNGAMQEGKKKSRWGDSASESLGQLGNPHIEHTIKLAAVCGAVERGAEVAADHEKD